MRLDISRILNVDKLDWAINRIGKEIAYIVMNDRTACNISMDNPDVLLYQGFESGTYKKYKDIPISICNGMKYGEIDIVGQLEITYEAPFIGE